MAPEVTTAPTSSRFARVQQAAAMVSQIVVLVGALAAAVGWASGFVDEVLDRVVVSRIDDQLRDETTALGSLRQRAEGLEVSSSRLLGDWRPVVVGQTSVAEADGFLLAHSGGNGDIARFYLRTGESEGELTARTRGVEYDGAATPVKKGRHYQVQVRSGDRGTITAY